MTDLRITIKVNSYLSHSDSSLSGAPEAFGPANGAISGIAGTGSFVGKGNENIEYRVSAVGWPRPGCPPGFPGYGHGCSNSVQQPEGRGCLCQLSETPWTLGSALPLKCGHSKLEDLSRDKGRLAMTVCFSRMCPALGMERAEVVPGSAGVLQPARQLRGLFSV